jgi:hypothetical protein
MHTQVQIILACVWKHIYLCACYFEMICAFALLNNKFCLRWPLDNTFAPFLPMSPGPISTGQSKKTSKPVASMCRDRRQRPRQTRQVHLPMQPTAPVCVRESIQTMCGSVSVCVWERMYVCNVIHRQIGRQRKKRRIGQNTWPWLLYLNIRRKSWLF